ncbi:MAG: NigD-like N-terminal domain-containing protein [Bacteroidales bacterium]|nr:NigD-like N-terminal domain-containing protein [Bacteroidales bacterium]MCM1147745.1 NigD-like N-terminal domain-containing protein [Bacteroidales bacterium]MCM1206645.1 NigD-like N-terminal domain-containing protein [Bacillota bacterium]MCM1510614.1 NigD-like N-terminal domain-containing protein [Clostridium sp.]
MKMTVLKTFCLALLCGCIGCSTGDDEGDGYKYPQMVAELCDVHTTEPKELGYAVTDSDERLTFSYTVYAPWATERETRYRALLYYNKVEHSPGFHVTVQAINAKRALILTPKTPEEAKEWYGSRDPLSLATAWFAKNGKYLNLCLDIKSGSSGSEDAGHSLGIVCEKTDRTDGRDTYHYRLCHGQNGVPAYYTVSQYVSIPTEEMRSGDIITLEIPTWEGTVTKEFIKP